MLVTDIRLETVEFPDGISIRHSNINAAEVGYYKKSEGWTKEGIDKLLVDIESNLALAIKDAYDEGYEDGQVASNEPE